MRSVFQRPFSSIPSRWTGPPLKVVCPYLRPCPGHTMPGWLGPDFAYVFASRSLAESGVSWTEMPSLQKSSPWFLKWEWEGNKLWGPKYLREGSRIEIYSSHLLWFKPLSYKDRIWYSVWNQKVTYYNKMQTFPQGTQEPLTRWTRKFPTLWKSWEKLQTFSEVLASTLTSSVRHSDPPKSENSWGLRLTITEINSCLWP